MLGTAMCEAPAEPWPSFRLQPRRSRFRLFLLRPLPRCRSCSGCTVPTWRPPPPSLSLLRGRPILEPPPSNASASSKWPAPPKPSSLPLLSAAPNRSAVRSRCSFPRLFLCFRPFPAPLPPRVRLPPLLVPPLARWCDVRTGPRRWCCWGCAREREDVAVVATRWRRWLSSRWVWAEKTAVGDGN